MSDQVADRETSGAAGIENALCRSLLFEALSLALSEPADAALARLRSREAREALLFAAGQLDRVEGSGLGPLAEAVAGPGAVFPSRDALSMEYQRLFGHTARGPVSAYETEYGDDTLFQKPQEMSDVAGFFGAFGLTPASGATERVDHIACEVEFASFLARKEAYALESGDTEMLEVTRAAQRSFFRDHLGRFVPSFARRTAGVDPDGFHARAAMLLLELTRAEGRRLEVSLGPEMLRLREPVDDGAPMACGSCDGAETPGDADEADAGSPLVGIDPPLAGQ
jgi:TorA maturation chaperone TorD